MKTKLLFLLEGVFWYFGVAKAIYDNFDCEVYSIINCDHIQKKFFQDQKLLDFKKSWFYRDHINIELKKKPDIEYLKKIEERLSINLWNIAYSDRYFYKFDEYHHYSYDQILLILEQECKLIEEVIDEADPDFLIIYATDHQFNRLLAEICKLRGITVLMQGPSRFGSRELVYEDFDKMSKILNPISESTHKIQNSNDLKNYIKNYDASNNLESYKKRVAPLSTIRARLKRLVQLFFIYSNKKFLNEWQLYGRTRSKSLLVKPKIKLRRRYTNYYLNKISSKEISSKYPFIYFPLHLEPERALGIAAPYLTNQVEVITHIAKSLPVGIKLYVKDHPAASIKDPRKTSFYKELNKLQNVSILHPSLDKNQILEKCLMVINITSTTGLEAAFFNKPVISLTDTIYSKLSHVRVVKNFEELPSTIKSLLNKKVDEKEFIEFVNYIHTNSLEINMRFLASAFEIKFRYHKLNEEDMKSAINENKDDWLKLASWYIKKIQ